MFGAGMAGLEGLHRIKFFIFSVLGSALFFFFCFIDNQLQQSFLR
jgi:hypothetical protein